MRYGLNLEYGQSVGTSITLYLYLCIGLIFSDMRFLDSPKMSFCACAYTLPTLVYHARIQKVARGWCRVWVNFYSFRFGNMLGVGPSLMLNSIHYAEFRSFDRATLCRER